jgi:hypothetical protein
MTSTLLRSRSRQVAVEYVDRHADAGDDAQPLPIVRAFWTLMGCTSQRTAERQLNIVRRGIPRLADACRRLDRMDYLRDAHAYSDALRRNGGPALQHTAELLVAVAKADSAEDLARLAFAATPNATTKRAFIDALRREVCDKSEQLAALEAS